MSQWNCFNFQPCQKLHPQNTSRFPRHFSTMGEGGLPPSVFSRTRDPFYTASSRLNVQLRLISAVRSPFFPMNVVIARKSYLLETLIIKGQDGHLDPHPERRRRGARSCAEPGRSFSSRTADGFVAAHLISTGPLRTKPWKVSPRRAAAGARVPQLLLLPVHLSCPAPRTQHCQHHPPSHPARTHARASTAPPLLASPLPSAERSRDRLDLSFR